MLPVARAQAFAVVARVTQPGGLPGRVELDPTVFTDAGWSG